MNLTQMSLDIDGDGIATITWDMPDRSMNVLSEASISECGQVIDYIVENDDIKGVVLTSGKDSFLAGADLSMLEAQAAEAATLSREARARKIFDNAMGVHAMLRKLEYCGKPVASAAPGTALGGGLELLLATHYRVVADNPRAQLGLPECQVGLLPGAGGTQRLPRLVGVLGASEILLMGKPMNPAKAKASGVIHDVVEPGTEVEAARTWVRSKIEAGQKIVEKRKSGDMKSVADFMQPWDQRGYKIPGGGPYHPAGAQNFIGGNAMLRKNTSGNYDAQRQIMSAVYNGLQMPFETSLKVEARHFTKLMTGAQSRNMIRTLFLNKQALEKGARRSAGIDPMPTKRVGMLGAGMMGAGIAYVSAMAGIEVVLLDRDMESAERGKGYTKDLLDGRVKKKRMTQERTDQVLALITPTASCDDLKDVDLIIEAVFEDPGVKKDVIEKTEAVIPEGCIFGSNTSTLPITGLAEHSKAPKNFIGIHFFSPVDKMQLVEIIMAQETGDKALAKALDYCRQIRKTPIVVNDSRGFYTSRCFGTYVHEGQIALTEGIWPAFIDNVGRMTGMPRGPLEMSDDVALDLGLKVQKASIAAMGNSYVRTGADDMSEEMVEQLGRHGRKNGKGFYDYPEGRGKKKLWPGLAELKSVADMVAEEELPSVEEFRLRLLTRQALETARCFEEGVVTDVRDADVGSIFAWGFAPYTGGTLSYIDTRGIKRFVADCEYFAKKLGPRFEPTPLLRDMAVKDEGFYDRFNPNAPEKAAA